MGTSSMLLQTLCIILYPLVNSNPSYRPETPNLGQILLLLEPCDIEILAIGEFKLELQSGNAQSGSNSTIALAM